MKIASNTPSSFYPESGYEFVWLGDEIESVSIILLMLEKNWGVSSIDKIKALLHWVSSYPKHVPCYIIGCESTIPEKDVSRYRHKERDGAVRALCDEVLSRSNSIGVRGEITKAYLTEIVGLAEEQVDIIYDEQSKDNLQLIRSFLNKNNLHLASLEKAILKFQSNPRTFYERPIDFENEIIISKPYITNNANSVRLNADIRIDGKITTLWCETDNKYRDFLLVERSDPFLCVILPYAMRAKKDIVCEAPVSEQFLHNLNEILIPHLSKYDPRLYGSGITAASDSSKLLCGNAVATGMSCGVDSFYTTSLYVGSKYASMNLTHLYCGNYAYGNSGPLYERAEQVSNELGLKFVRTATNINNELHLPHLPTHFFKTMFGVLSLRKLFRTYYYSTTYDFGNFDLQDNSVKDTAGIELLLLYVFSSDGLQISTGGANNERLEKTRAICKFPVAHKFLNVCLNPHRKTNCGKCGKCMRTLLTLDMLGSLELFKDVFDIDEYKKNRIESFVHLVGNKNSVYLADVYRHFLNSEPLLVQEAAQIFKLRLKAKSRRP